MRFIHKPDIDYVSIDFKEEIEAKTFFKDGIIVRQDKRGNVIGIDITDSARFFSGDTTMSLQEACTFLGISESTMRRRIREGKIRFTKPNGKDFVFQKADILKSVS